MLFSKVCFRKLHLKNPVQIQKQNLFSLKLYNKIWHSFYQRKIPEAGTKRLDLAEIESRKRSPGLRVFVGGFDILNLVFTLYPFLFDISEDPSAQYFHYPSLLPLLFPDLSSSSSFIIPYPT